MDWARRSRRGDDNLVRSAGECRQGSPQVSQGVGDPGQRKWIGGAQGLPPLLVGPAVEQAGGDPESPGLRIVAERLAGEDSDAVLVEQQVGELEPGGDPPLSKPRPQTRQVRIEVERTRRRTAPGPDRD